MELKIIKFYCFLGYSAPDGFCFDIRCRDDPIIDDNKSPEYNLDKKVSTEYEAQR